MKKSSKTMAVKSSDPETSLTRKLLRESATTERVRAGNNAEADPEFVRVPDVQRRAGIRRGVCYRRIGDGTFKSLVLREPGNKQGCRLVFWPSVKAYLHRLMAEQGQEKE